MATAAAAAAGGGGGGFGGSGMVAVCFGGDVVGRNERRVEGSFGGGIWVCGFWGLFSPGLFGVIRLLC